MYYYIIRRYIALYRLAIEELYEWKKSANRKPLIIEGARQVGKTWLMKGRKFYRKL